MKKNVKENVKKAKKMWQNEKYEGGAWMERNPRYVTSDALPSQSYKNFFRRPAALNK